jgi:succinate-semialdehyde dehydrogenase/glutarate-semialdehyde dehydrogenase
VHDRIQAAFADQMADGVRQLRVGDPNERSNAGGPLVDKQGLEKVAAHVDDALSKGANAVVGGHKKDGLFFEPTLLLGVKKGMRILEEETFGPVAPIVGFTDEGENRPRRQCGRRTDLRLRLDAGSRGGRFESPSSSNTASSA